MIRLLFLGALVLTVVAAIRALMRPRRVTGSVRAALEPEYVRSEDFVEILAREDPDQVAAARGLLDSKSIPTMVVATTLMVPRSRLDEARSVLGDDDPSRRRR